MSDLRWTTEKRKIADLKHWEQNPRIIKDANFKKLKSRIEKRGFHDVLKVVGDEVISGNQRLEALKQLGYDEVTVLVPSRELTEEEKGAVALESNWSDGEHDFDKLFSMPEGLLKEVGWDDKAIQKLIDGHTEAKEDDYDVSVGLDLPCSVAKGDIWQLGSHRLHCADSTDPVAVQKLMDRKKAHLFLTDPPYGVSYTAKNIAIHGDKAPKTQGENEIENDEKTIEEIKPVWFASAKNAFENCDETASYYWFACQGGDQMMMMMMMIGEAGWKVRHELIWVKSSMVFGRSDYHYQHEPILYGWKKKCSHTWKSDRKQVSVLNFDRPSRSELHPTTKPVPLIAYLLKNNTDNDDIVLDLFLGSGSTLIACEQTGRICYGMEIDPKYCQVIIDRWEKFTGKKAVKVS